jgi:titin
VVVVATGFAPSSWVYVRLQSDPVPIGMVQADVEGRVALTVTIPAGMPPGAHDVIVEGIAPDGSVRQFVQPFVVPAPPPTTLPATGAAPRALFDVGLGLLALGGLAAHLGRRRTGHCART